MTELSLVHRFIQPTSSGPFHELFNKPLNSRDFSFVDVNTAAYFCPFFIGLSLLMTKSSVGISFGVRSVRFEFLTADGRTVASSTPQTDTSRSYIQNMCEFN